MPSRKFTCDELDEGLDNIIFQEEEAGKHDCTWVTAVFPFEGKLYQISFDQSYNEGRQLFQYGEETVEAFEVEAFEDTVMKYRIV